jgi:hypothetical protein
MSVRLQRFVLAAVGAALLGAATLAQAQIEIQWWHAMTAANNDRVNNLAKRFNESQSEYKVNAVYKGSYPEAMAAAVAAFRAGNAPHILQVFEVGTATMMAAKGAIKPVYEVMSEAGETFDPKVYVPAVAGYYTNSKGQMLSFPFNSSTTVFWYNKDAFEKAGLDPNRAPADLARGRRRDGEAQGVGPRVPVHDRLADVDAARELLGLAQRAVPHQGERLRRPRREARVQRPGAGRHIANLQEWLRRATSSTAAARTSPRRSSTAASAR